MLQEQVTLKEVNGSEMHITSAMGRKMVKNMKTKSANNTAHYECQCVRMTLGIMW
jgi:hypothetical protein